MKVQNICYDCLDNDSFQHVNFAIRDDGIHEVICPNDHRSFIFVSNPLFEILFDYGLQAMLDEYTREAVASISASLERFYEFYIKVIQLKHKAPSDEIEKSWKQISSQSERQLGGFVSLYLVENMKAIKPIDPTFRNKVIHKGKIPTYEEAFKYGAEVFSFVKDNLNELKRVNDKFVKKQIKRDLDANVLKNSGVTRRSSMQITTTFLSNADLEYPLAPTTFKAALELVKTLNRMVS